MQVRYQAALRPDQALDDVSDTVSGRRGARKSVASGPSRSRLRFAASKLAGQSGQLRLDLVKHDLVHGVAETDFDLRLLFARLDQAPASSRDGEPPLIQQL